MLWLYFRIRQGVRSGGGVGIGGVRVRMVDGDNLSVRTFFRIRIGCPGYLGCQECFLVGNCFWVSGIYFWVVGNFLGGLCPDACACVHVAGVRVENGLKS